MISVDARHEALAFELKLFEGEIDQEGGAVENGNIAKDGVITAREYEAYVTEKARESVRQQYPGLSGDAFDAEVARIVESKMEVFYELAAHVSGSDTVIRGPEVSISIEDNGTVQTLYEQHRVVLQDSFLFHVVAILNSSVNPDDPSGPTFFEFFADKDGKEGMSREDFEEFMTMILLPVFGAGLSEDEMGELENIFLDIFEDISGEDGLITVEDFEFALAQSVIDRAVSETQASAEEAQGVAEKVNGGDENTNVRKRVDAVEKSNGTPEDDIRRAEELHDIATDASHDLILALLALQEAKLNLEAAEAALEEYGDGPDRAELQKKVASARKAVEDAEVAVGRAAGAADYAYSKFNQAHQVAVASNGGNELMVVKAYAVDGYGVPLEILKEVNAWFDGIDFGFEGDDDNQKKRNVGELVFLNAVPDESIDSDVLSAFALTGEAESVKEAVFNPYSVQPRENTAGTEQSGGDSSSEGSPELIISQKNYKENIDLEFTQAHVDALRLLLSMGGDEDLAFTRQDFEEIAGMSPGDTYTKTGRDGEVYHIELTQEMIDAAKQLQVKGNFDFFETRGKAEADQSATILDLDVLESTYSLEIAVSVSKDEEGVSIEFTVAQVEALILLLNMGQKEEDDTTLLLFTIEDFVEIAGMSPGDTYEKEQDGKTYKITLTQEMIDAAKQLSVQENFDFFELLGNPEDDDNVAAAPDLDTLISEYSVVEE